ncbi:MAG: signal peptidase I [Ruminococcus sp.]|nr:signal peptidase I [Ruminococcus sp.]MDE6784042.1 signal peptidase I [Ruminococcus sp.]
MITPENPEPAEQYEQQESEVNENNEAGQQDSPKKKRNLKQDIIDIAESTICTVFVIVMLFTYLLRPVNIIGHSMVPTLNNTYTGERANTNQTDKVLMSTVFFNVKYGDILVIEKDKNYLLDENGEVYQPDDAAINECIIKRVIACGGQTVDIRNNQVIVDGEVINEPYIAENSTTDDLGAFTGQYPITVPEGYYFVMGDNRNHSTDSRARSIGLVKKDQIYGKAILKYYPIDEFDILTDSWKG